MAGVLQATAWQKGFICQCHCLYCCLPDSQAWPVWEVNWSHWLTNGCIQQWGPAHVLKYGKSASSVHTILVYVLQSTWCAIPVCSNV